ncbi:MAG: hypothetical protein KAT53_06865, partial [Dehalococcoidia bacterium]|nr:hypothetical protein [Dehalococcoidia bacterium]
SPTQSRKLAPSRITAPRSYRMSEFPQACARPCLVTDMHCARKSPSRTVRHIHANVYAQSGYCSGAHAYI